MRGSRGGTGGPDPSGKSQVICVFMEISIWTPPPWKKLNPPEKCWTPLQNCKISWGLKIKNNVVAVVFSAVGPPPSPPLTKIPGSAHRKENSNRIPGTFKLCARKCLDNIEGHLQRFSDSYISQLWYYRFFFYPTDIPSPHIGWHFANSLSW